MSSLIAYLRPALVLFAAFTVLTGLFYPVAVTAAANALFSEQAVGSLIVREGVPVGSELIGQPFDDPRYFWGRQSATRSFPYNAAASGGSNLGPTNASLLERVRIRSAAVRALDPENDAPVPVDLVTASASGLDPHISVASAHYQAPRVASLRGLDLPEVLALIDELTEHPQLGFLGEPRVNVLLLNLTLEGVESWDP